MAHHPWLDPDAFFFEGGKTGVLLVHGLTGAPTEMRPLGEHIARLGYTVSGPRLAGHGTHPDDLAGVTWQDWYASVDVALDELLVASERVFVVGLSLGALLSARLAAMRPEVTGAVVMAPALRVSLPFLEAMGPLSRLVPVIPKLERVFHGLSDPSCARFIWSYTSYPTGALYELARLQRVVRADLARLRKPLFVVHGRKDRSVPAASAEELFRRAPSFDKELLWLEDSGHTLTVDREREAVCHAVGSWLQSRA